MRIGSERRLAKKPRKEVPLTKLNIEMSVEEKSKKGSRK